VFVGRLDYPKQPLMIPQIARSLEALRPEAPWRLLVAGDGTGRGGRHSPSGRVEFGPSRAISRRQDDPTECCTRPTSYCCLRWPKGLPRALIEAQAAGRPIVASAAKGIREVVTPETGFLCFTERRGRLCRQAGPADRRSIPAHRLGVPPAGGRSSTSDTVANHRRIAELYDEFIGIRSTGSGGSAAPLTARPKSLCGGCRAVRALA